MNLYLKYIQDSQKLHLELQDHSLKTKKVQKFKETRDSQYIYQNELRKSCFQHDMAYVDFKDLTEKTTSDKIMRDKAFNIAKNPKYGGYQKGIDLMFY